MRAIERSISGLSLSADGAWLAASNDASRQTKTAIWNIQNGAHLTNIDGFCGNFHPSLSWLTIHKASTTNHVIEIPSAKILGRLTGTVVERSSETTDYYSWSKTGNIHLWPGSGKCSTLKLPEKDIWRLAISSCGKFIAAQSKESAITFSNPELETLWKIPISGIARFQFSRSSSRLFIGDEGAFKIIDTRTGNVLSKFGTTALGTHQLSHPDGSFFITVPMIKPGITVYGGDHTKTIHIAKSARRAHLSQSTRFLALENIEEVSIYSTSTWECVLTNPGSRVSFSQDDLTVVIGDTKGDLRILELTTGRELQHFSMAQAIPTPIPDKSDRIYIR